MGYKDLRLNKEARPLKLVSSINYTRGSMENQSYRSTAYGITYPRELKDLYSATGLRKELEGQKVS